MEYVDIVNEFDEVTGRASKDEAHSKGLLHRVVLAEVIGSDGKWTLIKQSSGRQDPGLFVSPIGGHVASGESPEAALKREAHEEYGLTELDSYQFIGKKTLYREVRGRKEHHYYYLFEIRTDTQPKLNTEAVSFERLSSAFIQQEVRNNPKKFGEPFRFIITTFYLK